MLDPRVRGSVGLKIKDKVVIFDEAHNIEHSAEEAQSQKLSLCDLKFTMQCTPQNSILQMHLKELLTKVQKSTCYYGNEISQIIP